MASVYKAYFIMRTDLELPAAKLAVQIGHAVDLIWLNSEKDKKAFDQWRSKEGGNRRKIILKAKSLKQLENLKQALERDGLHCFDIVDSGYTVVEPDTVTGIVVFPTNVEHKNLKRLQCM